jgi:hypothetical protein
MLFALVFMVTVSIKLKFNKSHDGIMEDNMDTNGTHIAQFLSFFQTAYYASVKLTTEQ